MPSLPTGTVTFLFTDIEGSTRLLQQLGDRYAEVLAGHRRLLRAAFQDAHGQEMDTQGDALFVAFSRAKDALLAAVAAQRAVQAHPWPEGVALRVRMGLHTGEPLSGETGYVGMDVHRAARICAAGHGGQMLLSQTARDLVVDALPEGVSLRDLGEYRLKDLAQPHRLYQVVTADLPADFPPLRSLDVFPNNLPRQLTSFVGREREMIEIRRLLRTTALLALTGTGGAGKTRLALQVAAELLEEYPDGVFLVELAPLSDPDLVQCTVASTLGVREQSGCALIGTLIGYLQPKTLLLMLDNCEHLLSSCAQLADTVLRACPHVRVLVTSREGLGIAGELTFRVPSLALPDPRRLPPLEHLTQYEAVRLFIERAVFHKPSFALGSGNAAAVVQVCHRLDGIPLAIELAAARVKVLAVEQIAARLDDRFRLLTGGGRAAPPQHQTLRAVMDWSYGLLGEQEQAALRRLSVFAGGFSLEAAEAFWVGDGVGDADVLDLLAHLVDKSLVVAEEQAGEVRYRLLETVREYARDRLQEAGEAESIRSRHFDFFLRLAERAESELEGAAQAAWLNCLEGEHDNLRAALRWSIDNAPELCVRLAAALGEFWLIHGHFAEGRGWLGEALSRGRDAPAALRAKALNGAGFLATRQGEYAIARSHHEQSLAIYQQLHDQKGIAESIDDLGSLAANQGDSAAALALHAKGLAIYRELGYRQGIAKVLGDMGHQAWHQSDHALARSLLEESLVIARELGNKRRLAYGLWGLGLVALDQLNYSEAHALFGEGLTTAKEIGDAFSISVLLEASAALAVAEKEPRRAACLLGVAEGYRESTQFPVPHSHRSDYDRLLSTIRTVLNTGDLASAWAEGRGMTLEQAVEYALKVADGDTERNSP